MLLCGSTIAWGSFIAYDILKIDSMLPFGRGFNPPSISFGVFALLIAATLFFAEMGLQPYPNGIPQKGMDAMAYFGRHTLYIFLYHRLFLDGIPHVFAAMGIAIENIWIKRVVFFCGMIFGSMLFEYILEKLHEQVRIAYRLK